MLGVSPTLIQALIPKGVPDADLSSLRAITTTGEPWNAGPYDWLNEHVAGRPGSRSSTSRAGPRSAPASSPSR